MTCAEIQTPVGFVFVILSVIMNQTNNPDCEQSWYLQDDRLIADPSDPQKLIAPVVSVSSDRLVTSHCVNLKHEIICDSADGSHSSHEIIFRVRNETSISESTLTPESHQLLWLLAVVIIVLCIVFLIRFLLRRRKLR